MAGPALSNAVAVSFDFTVVVTIIKALFVVMWALKDESNVRLVVVVIFVVPGIASKESK